MNAKEKLRHIFDSEETEDDVNPPLNLTEEFQSLEEIEQQRFNQLQVEMNCYFYTAYSLDNLLKRIDQAAGYFVKARNAAIIRAYELDHS